MKNVLGSQVEFAVLGRAWLRLERIKGFVKLWKNVIMHEPINL